MKDYEFYQKYANMPLSERKKTPNFEIPTPSEIYFEVKEINDKIRPDIIRKEKLLRFFEEYYDEKRNRIFERE